MEKIIFLTNNGGMIERLLAKKKKCKHGSYKMIFAEMIL